MTFQKWVEKRGGPIALAKEINVSPRTVQLWLRGFVVPRLDYYLRIKELSRGKITPEKMLEKYLEVNSGTNEVRQ